MSLSINKIMMLSLLFFIASFSFAQGEKDIQFDNKTLNFKKVDEGEIVELVYTFHYKGEIPISIIPPVVDCSCTTVILPEQPIQPNTDQKVKVVFDTKDKIGYQVREVNLQFVSDAMDSRSIEKKIIFKGVVKASKETIEKYKESKQKD